MPISNASDKCPQVWWKTFRGWQNHVPFRGASLEEVSTNNRDTFRAPILRVSSFGCQNVWGILFGVHIDVDTIHASIKKLTTESQLTLGKLWELVNPVKKNLAMIALQAALVRAWVGHWVKIAMFFYVWWWLYHKGYQFGVPPSVFEVL